MKEIPELERFRERLLPLNPYAVEMRYDEATSVDSEEVANGVSTVEELLDIVLELLPPEARP